MPSAYWLNIDKGRSIDQINLRLDLRYCYRLLHRGRLFTSSLDVNRTEFDAQLSFT